MTPDEAATFEQLEYSDDAVRLRRWEDEFGKLSDAAVPRFERYRPLLESLVVP